jgi:hypothetical protein
VGAAISKVLARKDLILRLETPRFATEGDTVTISGIIHNYLDSDKSTKVSVEVTGGQLLNAPTQTLMIAKQGEQRVDWRIATSQVGEVRLLAKALTDTESDAIELPCRWFPSAFMKLVVAPRRFPMTRAKPRSPWNCLRTPILRREHLESKRCLRSPGLSLARSITSPPSRMDAPSRRCPASCRMS